MANFVEMPQMGAGMEAGKILTWNVAVGDTVKKGDDLAEIETDKVAINAESFFSGVVLDILVPAGTEAKVGEPIAVIGEAGEKYEKPSGGAAAPAAAPAPAAAQAPAPSATPVASAPAAGGRVKASPLAKKIAAEKGVDLAGLQGSGPGGRVVKRDVEGAQAAAAAPSAAPVAVPAGLTGEKVPLTGMRKGIVRKMTESKAPVPHFYVTMAVDMDAAMALREQINAGLEKAEKISVNDMIVKACALALKKHPSLNAVFGGDHILYPDRVSISVAVAIDDGLIAPDIHDADVKSLGAIAREVKDKAGRAKAGKLGPDEYGQGTFTVSNLGMFGVEEFTAIITLPQSAAVAVGGVTQEPVVKDGAIVVGNRMRFTVSADHRITDGAGSAQFAAEVRKLLENPMRLML